MNKSMTTFNPDGNHCPKSCLCPMCKNDNDCDAACEIYLSMVNDCTECEICKARGNL
jgi:hypothetical protein